MNEFPCQGIPIALGTFISLLLLVVVAVMCHSGRLGGWPTTNDTVSPCRDSVGWNSRVLRIHL